MHALYLLSLLSLFLFPPFISATPFPSSRLPRSNKNDKPPLYCANAPSIIAGTHLPLKRSLSLPRGPNYKVDVIWCAYATSTYLSVQFAHLFPGPAVPNLLAQASYAIAAHIRRFGDGIVAGGGVNLHGADGVLGIELHITSSAGRRLTWGVVGSAVEALKDFGAHEGFGAVFFVVFDGENEVGEGYLR